jgi:hypothetical protein
MTNARACCAALLLVVACSDADDNDVPQSGPAPPAATTTGGGSATDDGGAAVFPDMLGRIRTGLSTVVAEAEQNRAEALRLTQEFYSTGMEPLLYTYGEGGTAFAGNALAAAVTRLDLDLQELVRLLEAPDTDIGIIRAIVMQAERTLAEVESEAVAAGIGG